MGMTVSFELQGGPQLERALHELPPRIGKRVINQALRAGAKVVAEGARQLVPVQSGRLKRSIKVRALRRSRRSFGVSVQTGAVGGRGGRLSTSELGGLRAGGDAYYGGFVEFGHRIGRRKGHAAALKNVQRLNRGGATHVAAHPFERDAMDERRGQVIETVNTLTAQGIEREFASLVGRRAG